MSSLIKNIESTFAKPYSNYSEVYPRSNETNQEAVAKQLKQVEGENRVHVGVSGMQNLDFIALTRPKYGILVDINKATSHFHEILKDTIIAVDNVDEFAKRFLEELSKNGFHVSAEHKKALTDKKDAWLQDGNWQYIKAMYENDSIIIANTNIAYKSTAKAINAFCKNHNATLGTLYISNVADWLIDNEAELSSLEDNIKHLKEKNPEMMIIDSDGTLRLEKNQLEHHPIVQKITSLKDEIFTLFTESRKSFMNSGALTRRAQMVDNID